MHDGRSMPGTTKLPSVASSGVDPADLPELRKWVPGFKPLGPGDQLRLLCFPYAGSGASVFRDWQSEMPPGIQVIPVQLPGRENRWADPVYVNMASLASKLVSVLHPVFAAPYALFGHSMGGLISFELARQLRKRRMRPPEHLFISSARAPHVPDRELPMHMLPDGVFLKELTGRFGGSPDQALLNRELAKVLLPILRADFALCETFHPAPDEPLGFPISVFGGRSDRLVVYSDLVGWSLYTRRAFKLQMFAGDHFFMTRQRDALLQVLSAELSEAAAKTNQASAT
jgi:surfactin synthase thioesterase subunit